MSTGGFDMSAFWGQFREEARELIQAATQGLLKLEQAPNDLATIKEIARAMHTLKGSARLMGLEKLNRLTHRMEDLLSAVGQGKLTFTPAVADLVLEALDLVNTAAEQAPERGDEGITIDDICQRIERAMAGDLQAAARPQPSDVVSRPAEKEAPAPTAAIGVPPPTVKKEPEAVPSSSQPVETPSAPPPAKRTRRSRAGKEHPSVPESVPESQPAGFTVFERRLPEKKAPMQPLDAVRRAGPSQLTGGTVAQEAEPVAPAPTPAPAPDTTSVPRPAASETIRVDIKKLDSLANVAGEMVVDQIKLESVADSVRGIVRSAKYHVRVWQQLCDALGSVLNAEKTEEETELVTARPLAGRSGKLGLSPVRSGRRAGDTNWEGIEEQIQRCDQTAISLLSELEHLSQRLGEDIVRVGTNTRKLSDGIMSVRMHPVSTLFSTFPRAVRDMARQLNKKARLECEGGDAELDKTILQAIHDPLLHLVRNALYHGIEPAEERQRIGKAPEGVVRLSAWQQGDQVFIQVSDDGRGIDPNQVREAAVRKGLLDRPVAEALTRDDCLRLIFESGFSTATQVDDISGRGVGMDVVKSCIEEIHGEVRVESTVGQGTAVVLALPLTLAISRALLVGIGGRTFAIPTASVDTTTKVRADEVKSIEGREAIVVRGETVPMLSLAELLGARAASQPNRARSLHLVVIAHSQQRIAFAVDELMGEQEIVVKPLRTPQKRVKNIAGAAIRGGGDVVVVLHIPDIMSAARASLLKRLVRDRVGQAAVTARKRVLVVEDSLPARELERAIFEAASFHVVTAVDGIEALEKLTTHSVDLVVTDIQMPRMDGFELTSRLKNDSRYRHIPVIIVTTRSEDADRQRGLELGADAYLVKSSFSQTELLEHTRRLIG